MTPAFDEAAFTLPLHTLSEPIRTPFGFHLIEVTGITPSQAPPLDQVRDTLRQRVARELAQDQFYAAAETLRAQAFEHPDSLQPAAEALDLKVEEAGPLTRTGGQGPAGNPEFLRHAFSADAIGGDNSEVFELGDGRYAVLRVTDHTPAAQRPFEDVRGDIEARLRQQAAAEATRQAAESLAQKLRAGEAVDTELAQHGATWKDAPDVGREGAAGIPDAVLKQAFSVGVTDGKPGYADVALADGSHVLLAVTARRPGDAAKDGEAREALRRQLLTIRADQALTDELAALRARNPVRVTDSALADAAR
jgi:peptidyl-prolyl cis-trans isomerase D